jgi:hypothetical protein
MQIILLKKTRIQELGHFFLVYILLILIYFTSFSLF